MRRAIYPGSFDPCTNGHLDIIGRAARLFDEVLVAVAPNSRKSPLFDASERVAMLEENIAAWPNVRVTQMGGLLVEFARKSGAIAIVRGLRAVSDFEFEFQMALMNRKLVADVETIFLMPKEDFVYLSSSIVKEIARLGGDASHFVTPNVYARLREKFGHPAPTE